ncbi:hypothetical protein BCR32DRAFT_328089, partial [Anaeromyces robustus]
YYMYYLHIYFLVSIDKHNILDLENQFYKNKNNDFKLLKTQSSDFRLLRQLKSSLLFRIYKIKSL